MRKLALLALLSLPIFAGFFPDKVHTSVASVDGGVKIKKALPLNGMSGIVVHNYGNEAQAITSYIIQTNNNGTVTPMKRNAIYHPELPTINTPIKVGDKVIGGFMYQNVLLLAPDATTYARITEKYNKNWIHPDLFALFLAVEGDDVPTRENLSTFARQHQVGLVMIIKKSQAVLLDPISGQIINQMSMSNMPANAQFPFFSRFDEIDSGWFSKKATGNFYDLMEKL